ncbi:MAG: TIM-barrel domain-containing protein [Myxococcota bacterium]|nr:TIM-barrel domain-containing protein [Myxococcota bacterium]
MSHLLALLACSTHSDTLRAYEVTLDRDSGRLDIDHATHGPLLSGLQIRSGSADATAEFNVGSFYFEESGQQLSALAFGRPDSSDDRIVVPLEQDGEPVGELLIAPAGERLDLSVSGLSGNRLAFSADCIADEPMLGLGSHAFDIDHHGEAFALWVSEPGIGKSDQDAYPDDWFLTGTRHSSSFPVPFLLRPEARAGLWIDAPQRIEVDLCRQNPERFTLEIWSDSAALRVFAGEPLDVIEDFVQAQGGYTLPQPWVFGPWVDAVRGAERVRQVAQDLRAVGASTTVIWTEDWKGAEQGSFGYHLKGEWFVDEELYPDVEQLAQELEDAGFKWFGYFSPFLYAETETWDKAEALGIIIQDEQGELVTFTGPTFETMTMVDLTLPAAQEFVLEHMNHALDLGFDGWMADYAEWLPVETATHAGSGWDEHNVWPLHWQALNQEVMADRDGSYFVRSGWAGTASRAPVVWAGDQRTSFDADDGLPTVLPLGLGLSLSGQPIYTHDIAGYQSIGNDPSDFELWARWAALGAFSPIMRTHHGAFAEDNHQFDQDEQTLALWAELSNEHMRLFPYRYGLAAKAASQGTPMILPLGLLFESQGYDVIDAWMLGDALLIAPVIEAGVTSRVVELPTEARWLDWWTGEEAISGSVEVPLGSIPVFVREGSIVPTFATAPDTLTGQSTGELLDLDDVDGERVLLVFGSGGSFTESDGTVYRTAQGGSSAGEVTVTLTSGRVEVGSAVLEIDGDVERSYRVRYVP